VSAQLLKHRLRASLSPVPENDRNDRRSTFFPYDRALAADGRVVVGSNGFSARRDDHFDQPRHGPVFTEQATQDGLKIRLVSPDR